MPTGAAVAAKPGLSRQVPLWRERPGCLYTGPPVTPWAAGDTSGKSRLPYPAGRPSVCRPGLLGQFFEGAAALAFPEDRYQGAGEERARDRDPQDEVPRVGHAEQRSGDQDAAPGAEVADAVGPVPYPASASGSGSWRGCRRTCSTATRTSPT